MLLLIFQVFLAVTIAKSAFEKSLEPNDTMQLVQNKFIFIMINEHDGFIGLQSEPIFIMISHIMINYHYHIVSNTDIE